MTDDYTKPTLDQVTYDALQLSLTDLEKLIELLTVERDGRLKGLLPKSEHGGEMPVALNYTMAHDMDVDRRILPEEQEGSAE